MISLVLMPGQASRLVDRIEFPRWDIPARIVAATSFVIGLTAAAPLLGPRLAGLLAPFPLYGAVLVQGTSLLIGRRVGLA